MVAVMPMRKEPKKLASRGKAGRVQIFTHITPDLVSKLDELAEDAHRSRSAQIAYLVESFVLSEHHKLSERRKGSR